MADKINPNSFFNQTDDKSEAIGLAQQAFDISNQLQAQVNELVKSFDVFKLEYDTENQQLVTSIEENNTHITNVFNNIQNSFTELTETVQTVSDDVDSVSDVFFKLQTAQSINLEAQADAAFREEDAAQKQVKEAKSGGGGAGGGGGAVHPDAAGDGPMDTSKPKKGLLGGIIGGITGLVTAPLNALLPAFGWAKESGLVGKGSEGLKKGVGAVGRGVGGYVDWLTGNRTDFDKKGGDIKDPAAVGMLKGVGRGITGGVDFLTGNLTDFDKKGGETFGSGRILGGHIDALTGNRTDFDKKGGDIKDPAALRMLKGVGRGITGGVDSLTGNLTDLDKKGGETFGSGRILGGYVDALTGNRTDFDKKGGDIKDPAAVGMLKGVGRGITGGVDALKGKGAVQKLVEGERPVITDDMTIEQQMVVQKKQKLWDMGQSAIKGSSTSEVRIESGSIDQFKQSLQQIRDNNLNIEPITGRSDEVTQQIIEPPVDDPTEVMDAINQDGMNQTIDDGDDGVDSEETDVDFKPATGTYCEIECINEAMSHSTMQIMF